MSARRPGRRKVATPVMPSVGSPWPSYRSTGAGHVVIHHLDEADDAGDAVGGMLIVPAKLGIDDLVLVDHGQAGVQDGAIHRAFRRNRGPGP
jgi:hypothetical protein